MTLFNEAISRAVAMVMPPSRPTVRTPKRNVKGDGYDKQRKAAAKAKRARRRARNLALATKDGAA